MIKFEIKTEKSDENNGNRLPEALPVSQQITGHALRNNGSSAESERSRCLKKSLYV